MTHPPRSRLVLFSQAAAPLALLALAAVILLRFPPEQYGFYPQCPIHRFAGVLCPGCGTTRALAALLHGELGDALRLNALTVLLLPVAGGYAATCYARMIANKPFRLPQPPPSAIYGTLAAATIFTIVRNL
ncbi:MAG: DUF2752 domain-containing protein [Acidobacteria bacterium]|nr:DUF2752 domain-containing protein [Acidobacteriota bacterium]